MKSYVSHHFWIQGINPEPWSAGKPYRRGPYGVGLSKDPKLKAYQTALAEEFAVQNPGVIKPFGGILKVTFFFWRNTQHGSQADATNLQKATEDALQGLLYVNDRENHDVRSVMMEQSTSTDPAILVLIEKFFTPSVPMRPQRPTVERFEGADWTAPEEEMF